MIITYILITILFTILGYIVVKYFIIDNVASYVSNFDGKKYEVRKIGSNSVRQEAADYLAKINHKIDLLTDYIYRKKIPDFESANRLYNRWKSCVLKETNSSDNSTAFTLNKSTEIRLCIRDENGNFEDSNTSMFIILHELSHVMSKDYGHGEEFTTYFEFLTHLASQLGIYKPENFLTNPKKYCGVEINSTPCNKNTCEFGTKTNELLNI